MKYLKKFLLILLGMGGILIDKISYARIILLAAIIINYFLYTQIDKYFNSFTSILLFVTIFLIRYIFLFSSFTKDGIANILKKRFGEGEGYEIYQSLTALMFFNGAMSFALMINKSGGEMFMSLNFIKPFLFYIGAIIMVIGFTVNTWSAMLIGLDIYYYKDLFLGRPVGTFTKKGPYLLLANPMYSLGQWNGYGTALIFGSVAGLLGIFMNQVMMYIFYFTIERPHIHKHFNVG